MGSGRYVNSDSALYLEAANVPEFAELVKRAKKEAEQLWSTINQLEILEGVFVSGERRKKYEGTAANSTPPYYFLTQPRSGFCVGGNRSPGSMRTIRGFGTWPPRGPTSIYLPAGLLSVPGLIGFDM